MQSLGLVRAPAPARRLAEVAAVLGVSLTAGAGAQTLITGVCLDSRAVQPGDLYAALPGQRTHGATFAAAAAASGAGAVLTDPDGALLAAGCGLPVLIVGRPRDVLGGLSAWIFGHPARQLLMLGVTGTNGKTTTTFLLDGALRRGGRASGLLGTVELRILDRRTPSVRTTPEAPDLQAMLALMVQAGVEACSMEVSSHALALGRVDGIEFDVAGFTNLSQDHLDFHPTMESYFEAKAALFAPGRARQAVICVDGGWGARLAAQARVRLPVTTLATAPGAVADWWVARRRPLSAGTDFTLAGPGGQRVEAHCPLPGDFNVANCALALVMLVHAGIDPGEAAGWLVEAGPVPGRMERVTGTGADGEPLAVVDYAHTPDAVAAALATLRSHRPGPLVVVFGAGGDRDARKRPLMGAAAAREADVLIVTDDNPRSEAAAAIRAEVRSGIPESALVLEIGDRRAAIAEGVARAWGGGTLLLAGKGHERGQEVAGVVYPFEDREVLAAALRGHAAGARPGSAAPRARP